LSNFGAACVTGATCCSGACSNGNKCT
jgi:hypothetical protein